MRRIAMTNEITKTGRMYVVWHQDPKVQTPAEGIERIIDSIQRTGAEYAWCTEVASEIVNNNAREEADRRWEDTHNSTFGIDRESAEYRQHTIGCFVEYGQRAVYEVRVRYVGKVDANGKFTAIKQKRRRK